jgi:hypothetical protein
MGYGSSLPGNLRKMCQSPMTERKIAATNQSQIDSRKNLFFLLQTLARQAQARAAASKSPSQSFITDEQIEEYARRNQIVM